MVDGRIMLHAWHGHFLISTMARSIKPKSSTFSLTSKSTQKTSSVRLHTKANKSLGSSSSHSRCHSKPDLPAGPENANGPIEIDDKSSAEDDDPIESDNGSVSDHVDPMVQLSMFYCSLWFIYL
jgi:hypothetical protein